MIIIDFLHIHSPFYSVARKAFLVEDMADMAFVVGLAFHMALALMDNSVRQVVGSLVLLALALAYLVVAASAFVALVVVDLASFDFGAFVMVPMAFAVLGYLMAFVLDTILDAAG